MARPSRLDQLAAQPDLQCDDRVVHVQHVRNVQNQLPATERIAAVSRTFAALADPTRLRIIAALSHSELCVCDLAASVGQSESAVSHHLRYLRDLGLVKSRRAGRFVHYSLDDDHVSSIYSLALEHVAHRLELATA